MARTEQQMASAPDMAGTPADRPGSPRIRSGPNVALMMCLAGIVLAAVAFSPAVSGAGTRALLGGTGAVLAFVGGSRLGRRRFGIGFDLLSWVCAGWLVLLVAVAAVAPLLPLGEHEDSARTLAEPIYAAPELFSSHPLGTNALGLDIFSRVIHGARISLTVCVSAVVIGMAVGSLVGIAAGYLRGKVDAVVGVLTNSLLSVPTLILLIALASVLQPTPVNMAMALSVVAVPGMIRVSRANTLALAQREYVTVARALGAGRTRVILRELLPNVVLAILPLGMIFVSLLIVAEASLSFLGIGIQPPQPTWGNMIAEGQGGNMEQYPFLVVVPATVLFLTVFAFNLLGERLRNLWDTRQVKL